MTLVYGNPCAIHVDPVEKKPLFHFLPGSPIFSLATAGCNLHCQVCQNWEISQRGPDETENYELPPQAAVDLARREGCASLAYTYSEPIIFYEYAYDTSRAAREAGLKNVLVTAGYINEEPLRDICPLIDAANVDLKGDDDFYRRYCAGSLAPVQRTLEVMTEMGVWLEITNLLIPTLNDSPAAVTSLVSWVRNTLGDRVPLHFSRFHPNYRLRNLPPTPRESLIRARNIAREAGMKYVYVGNAPGLDGGVTFCPTCREKVIERRGFRVRNNRLAGGRCPTCQTKIEGIWD